MSAIGGNSLPPLAAAITAAHQAHRASAIESAASGIEAGRLLIEAKGLVSHGQWALWLESNVGFSERTARRYMQLARDADGIKLAIVADLAPGLASHELNAIVEGIRKGRKVREVERREPGFVRRVLDEMLAAREEPEEEVLHEAIERRLAESETRR
jgi:hypothetical protein